MARALAWLQSCVQALRRDGRIWPLFVLAVLPGAILLAVLIAQQGSQIQSTRAELEGIVSFRATTPLLRAVYAHRRQVRAALTQGPQAATETEIARIEGDSGAKHLIGEHADLVCEVEMTGEAAITDIDTPEALAAWRARAEA